MASGAQTEITVPSEFVLEWVQKDKRRFLHVVYRVGDLERTIKFYIECFGMTLLRKMDVPKEKYSNAFIGFRPEDSHFVVELTYTKCDFFAPGLFSEAFAGFFYSAELNVATTVYTASTGLGSGVVATRGVEVAFEADCLPLVALVTLGVDLGAVSNVFSLAEAASAFFCGAVLFVGPDLGVVGVLFFMIRELEETLIVSNERDSRVR
ncbi:uncharacterized protein A4U43_C05F6700 [Asparagus officinalis]|uniref:VOC domain-containing protein n=1 Tax=Asparagus officinalis TaxID=4686 RepID=A0A5P1EQG2_ASPOF|nr:uncharacterized protein A4U43_C05F6700 [Asparagus officinalis]